MTKLIRGSVDRKAEVWDKIRVEEGTAPIVPAALGAGEIIELSIQCDTDSPESIYVGNQYGQYREITIGSIEVLPVLDLSIVYVRSAGGTGTYNWMAGE